MLELKVLDHSGQTLEACGDSENISLVYSGAYEDGDVIALDCGRPGAFCVVGFEDSMPPALVYLKGRAARFAIPFGDRRGCYSPKSFTGARHLLTARFAADEEIHGRRNLAFNPYDQGGSAGMYPHVSANIETRGESVFAARNAIDGLYANRGHGEYPYGSWGINRRPDAELRLNFGLPVAVDEVRLTLRADFPHDSYWTRATLLFSDSSEETMHLEKSAHPQRMTFREKTVEWVVLKELVKADDPSPFPALTQFELWGTVL